MSLADPRLTLARPDLAAEDLEGVAPAARYAPRQHLAVTAPNAALRKAPDPAAEQLDQLLYGESFDAVERQGEFWWGQARRDGYVGFVAAEALAAALARPTHWIRALRTFAFAEPSIKSRGVGPFSLNALVAVEAEDGDFARAADGGWFWRAHLAPIGLGLETDPAAVAERYLGAPYLWGGRDSLGLDCSGLVQQALYACGHACPRDTDQQQSLGHGIDAGELARNDLVFWRGHVGMMLDSARIIHANASHMAVAIEPLDEALLRIEAKGYDAPTAYRRL